MNQSDELLYRKILQKDKKALESLYDRYEKLLFSFAYKMTGEKELAEEVVQEVFIKLWTQKGTYDTAKGKFSSWLLTIGRNTAIDLIRKQKTQSIPLEHEEILPSGEPSIEDVVEWKEKGSDLRKAIAELGEEQQEMVELFYYKGLSQAKIADNCNIPLGTVKGRIRLALKHMRKIMAREEKGGEYVGNKKL